MFDELISAIVSDMNNRKDNYEKRKQDAIKRVQIRIAEERAKAYNDFYIESVESWYGAYSPEFYDRERGLDNVIDIRPNDDGTMSIIASDAKMTKMRKGGSLFNQVYINGWHGGAISPQGAYQGRAPYKVWKYWGKTMPSTESVDHMFESSIHSYDNSELDTMAAEIAEEEFSKLIF